MSARRWWLQATLASTIALAGCGTTQSKYDYGLYVEHMPRSILVLPPLDRTPEAGAPYGWLATATRPLTERGYYVFPVAMVDAMMKENGLPTAGEMHDVSLAKIDEVFGADAVLYVTLTNWGTRYNVIDSSTIVGLEARLVDVSSGAEIWRGARSTVASSNDGNQGGIAGMLAGALLNQLVTEVADPSRDLATRANFELFHDPGVGLLVGGYASAPAGPPAGAH